MKKPKPCILQARVTGPVATLLLEWSDTSGLSINCIVTQVALAGLQSMVDPNAGSNLKSYLDRACNHQSIMNKTDARLRESLKALNARMKNPAAQSLGKLGGRSKSDAKSAAARLNGKRGGRPKGSKIAPASGPIRAKD